MREALDRLVDVATANKAAATTRNFSNTANSATGAAVLGGATAQVLGGDIKGGAKTVIAGTLAPYLTAKLMTSPRFVHWLVGAQSAAGRSPTALGPWIGRLGVIASEHPELAQDIGPLMSAMLHPVDSIRGQRDRQAP